MATTGLLPAVDADVARVTEALHMITPRWNVRILLALNEPPQRYTQIANKLPYLHSGQLHPKVRSLCDAGLVERTEHSARHVTYGLTQRGRQLLPVLGAIAAWAEEYLEKPEQPLSAIEQIEDSLTLLTRRQAPAILWVLKARQEASARALARIVIPDGYWTSIYPPLRQLIDDGLVVTAGKGRPYRLSPGGDGLDAIRTILAEAAARLVDDGWILLEHGLDQGVPVRALLSQAGWRDPRTHRDAELRDRVTAARAPMPPRLTPDAGGS